ncbi:MAG TPA: aldehyde dehydrogenase family protein [Myxococcales bacterium]|nr:aldehyde dehydrogenase family protein [Myxococcales bacterium]
MAPTFATVLIDPPFAFAVAVLLVLLSAPMIRRAGEGGWYGLLGPAFAGWMAGVFSFMFFRYPDWMFCYLIEAKLAPLGWLYPLFALSLVGGGAAGSALAVQAVLERRTGRAFLWLVLGLAVWGVLFALTFDQYTHVGTTLEFRQGVARPMQADHLFQISATLAGLAAAIPGVGLGLILIFEAFRTRRSLRPPTPLALEVPEAGGGPPLSGASPRDGTPLPPVATTPPERLPQIVAAARKAGAAWAEWPVDARVALLKRARDRFLAEADDAAELVALETGKPLAEAYPAEVVPNADLFSYWIGEAPRLLRPQVIGLNPILYPGKTSVIERLPRGVVALISPWNYPVSIPLRTLLPALAAGNAVVFKPSELTPRCGALLASWLQKELPPGVLQVVQGEGNVGAALVAAMPDLVAFTGSTATGRKIAEQAAKGPIPVSLELGGKDAAIVLEDADLERTADGVAWGVFTNAGQNCASIERIFVARPIAERFLTALTARAQRLRVDGADVELGPLISERQLRTVTSQIEQARAAGAKVMTGGEVKGLRVSPTLVLLERGVEGDRLSLVTDETFGPVAAVEVVEGEEEAIARANASAFGLAASVWTHDAERGRRVARRLHVGAVTVNNVAFTPALPMAPWSGTGASGYGVTNSPMALEGLTRPRYTLVDRNRRPELWWYPYDASLVDVTRGLAALQSKGKRSFGLAVKTAKAFLGRSSAQGRRPAA